MPTTEIAQTEQMRIVTVMLQFEAIDTEECVLDCDAGCGQQAEWIAFTGNGLHQPAFAFCNGCLNGLMHYACKQAKPSSGYAEGSAQPGYSASFRRASVV